MTRPVLLLSDLHLPASPSPLRDRFIQFLEGPAVEASEVFILGDLFESWIGDDVGLSLYPREVAALTALTARGVRVAFQHGNRDFLVGERFFDLTGVEPLPDPVVETLFGRDTLLSHGDRYCTDDRSYQRWRRIIRMRWLQRLFLWMPRSRRERFANKVRGESDQSKQSKPVEIMDVNASAVRCEMAQVGVTRLIHGHTHRPGTYPVDLPIAPAERIVLPDWRMQNSIVPGRSDYLSIDDSGIQRLSVT